MVLLFAKVQQSNFTFMEVSWESGTLEFHLMINHYALWVWASSATKLHKTFKLYIIYPYISLVRSRKIRNRIYVASKNMYKT